MDHQQIPTTDDVPNFGDQTPFLPLDFEKAHTYTCEVAAVRYHSGFNGRAFWIDIVPLESTNEAVQTGKMHTQIFKLKPDEPKNQFANQASITRFRRAVLATLGREDATNLDAEIQRLIALGDGLPAESRAVVIRSAPRRYTKKATATEPAKPGCVACDFTWESFK